MSTEQKYKWFKYPIGKKNKYRIFHIESGEHIAKCPTSEKADFLTKAANQFSEPIPNEEAKQEVKGDAFVFNHEKINEQIKRVKDMEEDSFKVHQGDMQPSDFFVKYFASRPTPAYSNK